MWDGFDPAVGRQDLSGEGRSAPAWTRAVNIVAAGVARLGLPSTVHDPLRNSPRTVTVGVDRPWPETSSQITLNLDVRACGACFHGEDVKLIRDLARSLSIQHALRYLGTGADQS